MGAYDTGPPYIPTWSLLLMGSICCMARDSWLSVYRHSKNGVAMTHQRTTLDAIHGCSTGTQKDMMNSVFQLV